MMENIVAGIDIGGTHITACLVNLDKATLISESTVREHIDTSLGRDEIISAWAGAIRKTYLLGGVDIGKIGIAMPGPFDYENGISHIKDLHKYESLYLQNVKDLLSEALEILPGNIKLINDASAFLLGEMYAGAGMGYSNLVGITLGTGLGSAAFYDNRLEEGDLYRTKFQEGCCEDYVSARWLIKRYELMTGKKLSGVKEIASDADENEPAKKVFEEFGGTLGRILHQRYQHQSPEVIIIGGNIAKAWNHFIPAALVEIESSSSSYTLKHAQLGEEAALTGAAYLWKD